MPSMTLERARRLAVAAQGLHTPRPAAVDVRHLRRAMGVNGVVQIDSVVVAARAHEMPFWSRIGSHDQRRRDDWLWRSREVVELVAHEQCLVPVELWPLFADSRVDRHRWKGVERLRAERPGYVESVYEHVAEHGPTAHGDLPEGGGERASGMWEWSPGKIALVWLAARGRLVVSDRDARFQVRYDLAERVLPPAVLATPEPSSDEAHRELLRIAARANGVATAADLADHWRLRVGGRRSLADTGALLEAMADDGELVRTQVAGWTEVAYRHPEVPMPRAVRGTRLLSPFDPLVWFRPRLERLWHFDYRIEIYVPKQKRRYGYYVLPVLHDGVLAGRVDLKADRAAGVLRVQASHAEPGTDREALALGLADELRTHAIWLGCDDVEVVDAGDLAPSLRAVV